MMDQKEAYRYTSYIQNLQGAKINVLPGMQDIIDNTLPANSPYLTAGTFMESVNNLGNDAVAGDFFNQKKELSEDRINLVLGEIYSRETLRNNNLKLLYEDLHKINNWRLERPFPDYYIKDRIWSDLNRSELGIREQIRREMKDTVRDMAFPQKDLRESLLEFKLQTHKNQLLGEDPEMEQDGSHQIEKGDIYPYQSAY
jgi:hypothetical protein